MTRRKIITSSLLLLLFVTSSYGQGNVKSFQEVIEKFYSTYDLGEDLYPRVEWEKKGEDWYIKTLQFDGTDAKRGEPRLFYDGKKGSFIDQTFAKKLTLDTIDYRDYADEYTIHNFNVQPYYGYNGWYNDVIRVYGAVVKPNDHQLYALGRAYSSKAIAPIINPNDDCEPAEMYNLSLDNLSLTVRQRKEFSTSQDSSISKFKQLAARTPAYETTVGSIRHKYANETMVKFHTLLCFANEEAAKVKLPAGIYEDSVLEIGREYLNACPPEAILVSFGDNDFYPVLYLQQREGLRKDVYLINYNLLAVDKFIYRATEPQFNAKEISIVTDTILYSRRNNEVINVKDSAVGVDVSLMMQTLASGARKQILRPTIHADRISVNLKIEKPDANGYSVGTMAQVPLKDIRYLLKNQWVFFNILHHLDGRKIVLTNNFNDELTGLNDYLTQYGIVFFYEN